MGKLQQWVAIAAVGVLGVLAAGWFLLVSPKKEDASQLRSQADSEQASATRLQGELAALKAQAAQLPRQQARLAAIARRIPTTPSLPSLVRGVSTAAETAGVDLDELSPADPTTAADIVAKTQGTATGGAGTTPAAGATGTAAKPAGTTGATGSTTATAATPTSGAAGVPAAAQGLQVVPISIVVHGGYYQVGQFLSNVEALQRSFLVAGFELGPHASSGASTSTTSETDLDLKISGAVFLSPADTTTSTPAAGAAVPAK